MKYTDDISKGWGASTIFDDALRDFNQFVIANKDKLKDFGAVIFLKDGTQKVFGHNGEIR